jgi:hypothetical protein
MATVIDYRTKQLLLSAIDRRIGQLVDEANGWLEQAAAKEDAGQHDQASRLRELGEHAAEQSVLLQRLWNDTKPVDVQVQLT